MSHDSGNLLQQIWWQESIGGLICEVLINDLSFQAVNSLSMLILARLACQGRRIWRISSTGDHNSIYIFVSCSMGWIDWLGWQHECLTCERCMCGHHLSLPPYYRLLRRFWIPYSSKIVEKLIICYSKRLHFAQARHTRLSLICHTFITCFVSIVSMSIINLKQRWFDPLLVYIRSG